MKKKTLHNPETNGRDTGIFGINEFLHWLKNFCHSILSSLKLHPKYSVIPRDGSFQSTAGSRGAAKFLHSTVGAIEREIAVHRTGFMENRGRHRIIPKGGELLLRVLVI